MAGKLTKKRKKIFEKHSDFFLESSSEAILNVISVADANFDESVDVDVVLGIDPSKGEQAVRGAVVLPHGQGKKNRILVFAQGQAVLDAEAAGADFVGLEDLIKKIEGGWLDFESAVATPDVMGKIGRIAKILGPRNLLPNKKSGTVTLDIKGIIDEIKKGRVVFKNDKGGMLHLSLGRVSFGKDKLQENFDALIASVKASKPASSKGRFVRKVAFSSTMGPGFSVNADIL